MQKRLRCRGTGIALALVAVAGVVGWAQGGDTPIVILDGSLTIQSAVPWKQYSGGGDMRSHPHSGKSVTKVTVIVNGATQTIPFSNQQCIVNVTYASQEIRVATGADGKGLTFSPFSAFQNKTETIMAHRNQNSKISHVTVMKGGTRAFDSNASGGTKITINYE
jgi:hypothetical protein